MTKGIIRTKLTILLSVIFTTMFLLSAMQVHAMSDVEPGGGTYKRMLCAAGLYSG